MVLGIIPNLDAMTVPIIAQTVLGAEIVALALALALVLAILGGKNLERSRFPAPFLLILSSKISGKTDI